MSLNVLITAASRRVAARAGDSSGARRPPRRLGASSPTSIRCRRPSTWPTARIACRSPTDPGYIDAILAICRGERVGLVVPTIDDELALFGAARDRFAALGIKVAVLAPATRQLCCNDKYATCRLLRRQGVPAAASWLPHEVGRDDAVPVVRQAAPRPRRRRRASSCATPRARVLPRLRRDAGRAGPI